MNQRSGLYGANQYRSPGGVSRVGSAGLLDQRGSNATRDVRHGLLAAMVGGVLLSSLQAQELSRLELLARIDAVVEQAMADGPLAGVSIGVRHGGETIVAKGYGYADLENDVRATEHTVYRIGSITKQFTATAIMMLVEDGKLSLDDELTTFLPDYPANDNTVTVRHLLNHTSGIKSYTGLGCMWQEKMTLALSHEELIALFADEPFDFPPGEQYRYNNSGYYLLGVIIEKVTDQSYAEVLRERVWDPLAMLESHYLYNAPIVRHRAEGYKVEAGALLNDDPLSMLQPFSAGALGSSVHDMLTWLQAFHERRVVSDDSYRQMTTPGTLNNGEALGYGFGLAVGDFEDHPVISHGGGINGFTTHSSYYPDDDIAIVVLCNTPTNTGRVERRIARLMPRHSRDGGAGSRARRGGDGRLRGGIPARTAGPPRLPGRRPAHESGDRATCLPSPRTGRSRVRADVRRRGPPHLRGGGWPGRARYPPARGRRDPGRADRPVTGRSSHHSMLTADGIKTRARELEFDLCGVAPAAGFRELRVLREWLDRGYAGEMGYMARTADRRADVRAVMPSARSVVVLGTLYNTDRPYSTEIDDPGEALISRYAWGDDYHDVLGARTEALRDWMRGQHPGPLETRVYVDTGPVQERVYAQQAGLGWVGKNTCLIHPERSGRGCSCRRSCAVCRSTRIRRASTSAGPARCVSTPVRPARFPSRACSIRRGVCRI